jgi:PAS domain S-box-containing protein
MQYLKKKTKAELISLITELENQKSQQSLSSEKLSKILENQTNESDKLETIIQISNGLFRVKSFADLGRIVFENFKKFKRPGNWGVKLSIYNKSLDEYWIIFPDGQPCVGAPIPTRCKFAEVGYYSKVALDSRHTLLINDNHSKESLKIDSRQIALSRGAMIFIPLYYNDIPVGLFSYSSSPENSINEDFRSFLEAISKLLTISIVKILKFQQTAEANFEAHDLRYKRLIDVITDYHYQVKIKDGIPIDTIHNVSSLIVTGYSPEEFQADGFLWFKMIFDDDRANVQAFISRIFRELVSGSIEHRIVTKDGELRWVKNTIIPEMDENGQMIAYDGLLQDITDKKLVEEQIKLSEEKLNKVFNQSPDMLIIVAYDDGAVIDINKTALLFFKIEKEKLIQKSLIELGFLDDELFKRLKEDINTSGLYKNYDFKFLLNNDDIYNFDLSAEVLEISGGNSILIAAEDRTKQKRMQSELERIHNLESIGILAGGIAHDFNNVLTAILGNISFVKMNMDSDDRMHKFLTRAEDSCFKAKELSNKLLTFSKGGRPRRDLISIEKLVRDYTILSLSGSNIFMNFQSKDTIDQIEVDQEQIRQVVTGIVENAKEAMPHGGELIVRIENESVGSKSNLPIKKGNYVKISFIDHGIGIPSENISKVFDPYFSTKTRGNEKGMGLGLSISHSIISKHNGCITVSSQVGLGSTFSVYLPSVTN